MLYCFVRVHVIVYCYWSRRQNRFQFIVSMYVSSVLCNVIVVKSTRNIFIVDFVFLCRELVLRYQY